MKEKKNSDKKLDTSGKKNNQSAKAPESKSPEMAGGPLSFFKDRDNLVILAEIAIILILAVALVVIITGNKGGSQGGNQGGNQGGVQGGTQGGTSDDNQGSTGGDNSGNNSGGGSTTAQKQSFKAYNFSYFDTVSTVVGYEVSESEFKAVSDEALDLLGEYHKLFDIYNEYDGIVNLCSLNNVVDGQHRKLKVDRKIIDMLLYAKEMYTLTDGRMNIAMGSVLSIWHDYRDAGTDQPSKAELPPMDRLIEAAKHTDINNIIIDEENSTVWLSDPDTKLDVGAIAKGYAVEMVAKMLEEKGKTNYTLNIGGNIRTIGTKANGEKWKAGVEDPMGGNYIEYIQLANEAIVTSGSYQRFYIVDGKSYHHIIDRETLMPADKGYLSVSVICKDSGMGDGLSTALFCMELEEALAFVNSLEGVEAMFVTENEVKHYSNGFKSYTFEP